MFEFVGFFLVVVFWLVGFGFGLVGLFVVGLFVCLTGCHVS